ncbi:MAG TPA: hypothetical protein VLF20_03200 [Patescibacteria group bacterium]|nr:hypothetical protein [Patescibacteria group bacterium]
MIGKKRENVSTKGLTKSLLAVLYGGAVVGLTLVFPNVGILYKTFKKDQWDEARRRGTLRSAIKRLEKQSLVAWGEMDGQTRLVLTEDGKKKVLQFEVENLQLKRPTKWDGLWRIIIFDIPENKKLAREIFRKKLKALEFTQLQKSVFVSRFPCKDEIDFLRHILEIAPFVHYVLAKELSGVERE